VVTLSRAEIRFNVTFALRDLTSLTHTNRYDRINRRIQDETDRRIDALRSAPRRAIDRRLRDLDREWDIERTLETNASVLALAGSVLGLTKNRWFFLVPAAVSAFLLQHALQGWCPPLPLFRRLGVRTRREIDDERHRLLLLRGDGPDGDAWPRARRRARRRAAAA
jgi:hypothetical protein